jgi:DNA (cytosine-5)-methyltransferase 1
MIPVVGDAMLAKCLTARGAGGGNCDPETANMIPVAIQGNLIGRDAGGPQGVGASDDGVMYTLTKADVHGVAHPIAIQDVRPIEKAQNGKGWSDDGTAYTVDTRATQGVAQPMAFTQNTRDEVRYINGDGQITGALAAEAGMKQTNYIAQPTLAFKSGQSEAAGGVFVTEEFTPTLQAQNNGSTAVPAITTAMQVRRLTPVECERLQGFPDGYTNIPWRKKLESPDGPRYKALGNSMAVPVMRWIGQRITQVEEIL